MTDTTRDGAPTALPAPAEVRETHSGVVLLLGDYACKVKKPVDLGFLDFRTEAARHRACRREVALNRRLAPDVYLDVVALRGTDGTTIEHAILMRRMPDDLRLSALVGRGDDVDEHLRSLARLLAGFHATARRGPSIATQGRARALRRRWAANLEETLPFRGAILGEAVHSEISSRALGYVDVLDDVAFLAMDLERLGRPELGERLLAWYAEFSGWSQPPSLEHHYVAYRAYVRAKVACIRASQGAEDSAVEARELAALTLRHLRAGEVSLVLVGGAPGTGKSTLSTALADRLGAVLLSSSR